MSNTIMKGFGTKAIHAGLEPDPSTGAVMTPIYQTSTYAQEAPGVHKGFEYSRTHNPTRKALENNLAALEGGKHGLVFASGLAAIDTLLKTLHPGDEVISTNDLYGGTYRLFVKVYEKLGLKFHFVPMQDLSSIEKKINEKTRLIWVETPTNPMLNVIDIESVATLAKSKGGILLAVDNTFSSPYLQQPLKLGADVVMHSATKYIGGHSDLVMGALITSNDNLAEQLYFLQNAAGAIPGPMDCFLALRGIKTLHVRMQRHCENAEKIARFLRSHPKVEKVFWPGFPDHPGHDIAKKQMRAFGGMISFTIKGDRVEDAYKAISSLKIFTLAESLGGVESLAGHPATMTHASIPKAERLKSGLSDSLIRLSIGLEDAEDLIADLKHVLQ
ncbi:cystathionine gamma-synthase [Schleiferia thermophila]|jgi:cystathionine beta-lyase|uniref:Cystathionine gamma-lyase n=2 Tax=Schleiferia thermophila TaxID=884107 RepID=A0A368ZY95_9FLAO|nr:cystathionine gamma-lyase [Schleiferia thermophila]GCD79787.1 cystathionine beta-lyase [Schleiferia thermophila]